MGVSKKGGTRRVLFDPLPVTFRAEETSQLLAWVQAGDSASIVGFSGVGKSNLFNHLLNPELQALHLKESARDYLFVRVNLQGMPDFTDRSLYSLILEQLELLCEQVSDPSLTLSLDQIRHYHDLLLNAGHDTLKVHRYFKQALQTILDGTPLKLVLLLDHFDEFYHHAEARLFSNLRGLREAYKYRLLYLVFTRDILTASDSGREDFVKLLTPRMLGLKPHKIQDAIFLLQRIAGRLGIVLDMHLANSLHQLTGGHASLLRVTFLTAIDNGMTLGDKQDELVRSFLNAPAVVEVCDRVWESLRVEEQRALARPAHGLPVYESDDQIEGLLRSKGMLGDRIDAPIFSPIFALYTTSKTSLWEQSLYLDEQTRQVWMLGRPAPQLTAQEYRIFQALYARQGAVVSNEELIAAVWPKSQDSQEEFYNQALVASIARLRKKIELNSDNPRFLENVRGQGYRLNIK